VLSQAALSMNGLYPARRRASMKHAPAGILRRRIGNNINGESLDVFNICRLNLRSLKKLL